MICEPYDFNGLIAGESWVPGPGPPALIGKYQCRFPGFDRKITARYAQGMSIRDIWAHVSELYGVSISPDLVSTVTDPVIGQAHAWQSRLLESTYALVFFDVLWVTIRDGGWCVTRDTFPMTKPPPSWSDCPCVTYR